MDLKLLIASDATTPLSVLAVAGLTAFSLTVELSLPPASQYVLVLTNGLVICSLEDPDTLIGLEEPMQTPVAQSLQISVVQVMCIFSIPAICVVQAFSVVRLYADQCGSGYVQIQYSRYLGRIATTIPTLYKRDDIETSQIDEWLDYAPIFSSGSEYEEACKLADGYLLQHNIPSINMTSLVTLSLSNNRLSGLIPLDLGLLCELSSLDLSMNKFNGSIPSLIGDFSKLFNLNFSNNKFTHEIPAQLGRLLQLNHLDLSHNSFSGETPSALSSLNSLEMLNLSWFLGEDVIPNLLANFFTSKQKKSSDSKRKHKEHQDNLSSDDEGKRKKRHKKHQSVLSSDDERKRKRKHKEHQDNMSSNDERKRLIGGRGAEEAVGIGSMVVVDPEATLLIQVVVLLVTHLRETGVMVDLEATLLIQGVVLLVTHMRETGVGAGHTLRIIVAGVFDHTTVAGHTLVLDPLIVGHRF
ncbi:MDIS1-interacting receptor like kinase 2-like protein [Tanacetum coccineum]